MIERLRLNLVLLYGSELIGKILGLVVFGYLGRTLLPARYGDLEFALAVLFLINLVIDAGLGHYGAREAAQRPDDTDQLVGQIVFVRGALVLVSLVLLALIAVALPRGDRLATSLLVLQGLVLLPAPLVLTWVFQARDEMHVVAVAAVVRQIVLAAGVLVFVRRPPDVWMVPVWDAVGLAIAVALQVYLFSRWGGSINPLRFLKGISTVVSESAPLAGASVVAAIRYFAPLLALGIYGSSTNVAIFGAGHRLVIAAHTFVWLYFFNLLPSLSRLGAKTTRDGFLDLLHTSLRLVGWVAICGATVAAVLAPVLIPLIYGSGLASGSTAFRISIWMVAVAFLSGHFRFGLIALSLQREVFMASAVGAAASVLGCLVLGSDLTPLYAAWILVGSEFVTLLAAAWLIRRELHDLRLFVGLWRPVLLTIAGVLGLRPWLGDTPIVSAMALLVLYAGGVAVFERHGIRRLMFAKGQ